MPLERGVALVERVIHYVSAQQPGILQTTPRPLPAELLDSLTLAGGKPLPPSLSRWLAFDAVWLELFADLDHLVLRPYRLSELMGPAFAPLEEILPGACYPLRPGAGDSSCSFLYAGVADDLGEYPVFVADVDDWYLVALDAPGLDIYLAEQTGFLTRPMLNSLERVSWFDSPELGGAMRAQSAANFRSFRMCEIYGRAASMDGKDTVWKEHPAAN
jgi:hypothetical protein